MYKSPTFDEYNVTSALRSVVKEITGVNFYDNNNIAKQQKEMPFVAFSITNDYLPVNSSYDKTIDIFQQVFSIHCIAAKTNDAINISNNLKRMLGDNYYRDELMKNGVKLPPDYIQNSRTRGEMDVPFMNNVDSGFDLTVEILITHQPIGKRISNANTKGSIEK